MIGRSISRFILFVTRWKVVGEAPAAKKMVVLAVPHTSNWDLLYMLCMAKTLGLKISWMGKASLFTGAKGWVLKRLGGLPVDRRAPQGLVAQLAAAFAERDELALTIPPAGTRSFRDHWKSGFYHIAQAADVPVLLSFLDWGTRTGGFGTTYTLTGDIDADMNHIREFYSGMKGRFPDKVSTIRLKEESAENAKSA